MTTRTAQPALSKETPNHWRNPGWRVLAEAAVVGGVQLAITAPLAMWSERVFGTAGLDPRLVFSAGLVLMPVLVPLEEWLFRGVILRKLVRPVGAVAALAISAVLFAGAHGDWRGLLPRFVGGLILGLLYLRTHSLWACITAHTVNNLLAIGWLLLT